MAGIGGGAKGQASSGTQNLAMAGGPTQMRTGGTGAFLGQQWDPSQWNTDLGLGYYNVPPGQQQGFAQGVGLGSGAKGQAEQWPAWSQAEPHPLVTIANHLASFMGSASGESDSGGQGASEGSADMGAAPQGGELSSAGEGIAGSGGGGTGGYGEGEGPGTGEGGGGGDYGSSDY